MQPKEHGSWSLALEPLTLGMLAAPSLPGGCLALAALAGFLARRPLRLARADSEPARRRVAQQAFAVLAIGALASLGAAFVLAGTVFWPWFVTAAIAGGVFLFFDLRGGGREGPAEIAGTAAFASLIGAIAAAAGWPAPVAWALLFAMAARAIPTVIFIRTYVRAAKNGTARPPTAILGPSVALTIAAGWTTLGSLPAVVPVALTLLWLRAVLLVFVVPPLRARTLGFIELALGIVYLSLITLFWPA